VHAHSGNPVARRGFPVELGHLENRPWIAQSESPVPMVEGQGLSPVRLTRVRRYRT
jgi:hypothetical protein